MRFREKDERGLHPTEAECPKGKTQIITILFMAIRGFAPITPVPPKARNRACFHSVGAFSGSSFGIAQKNQKASVFHRFGRGFRLGLNATQRLRNDIEVVLRGGYTPRGHAPPELVFLIEFKDK